MKRKAAAVILSLVMCMGTGLDAGAAAFSSGSEENLFTSGEFGDSPQVNEEMPAEPEQPAEPDTEDSATEETPEEELSEDIFLGEPEEAEDAFSSGTEETDPALIDAAGSVIVTAEDWEETADGFRLRKAGEEPESEYEYYTEDDGLLLISTEYKDIVRTGIYLFDTEGYLVTGRKAAEEAVLGTEPDTEFYFTDAVHAVVYSELSGEKITPYSSTLGRQVKNDWVWADGVFSFYNETGKMVPIAKLNEIYQQAGKYTGYFSIQGEYYCLDAKGKPRTGNITLNSAKYYFQTAEESGDDIPGRMFHEGWRSLTDTKGERWMYYNKGVTNPSDVGKLLERGIIATRLDTEKKGNLTYLIDAKGYLIKSTMKRAANGAYYCTDKNGAVYKDKLVKYEKYRYYFTSNGQRATWKNSWHRCPGASNRYYYFGGIGGRVAEKTGWQKVISPAGTFMGWYYFSSAGNHYTDKLTSSGYYFMKNGKLASGTFDMGGKTYMAEVSTSSAHKGKIYKDTMVYYKNYWFYAGKDGVLWKTGWKSIKGNWYYFYNYKALTKRFMKLNGKNGYLDSSGKYTTGWVIVSNAKNKVRYIDPDGDGYLKNGSKWVDGLLYYFDSNGYRIEDLTHIYGGPYYLKADRKNGVMTVYTADKKVPVKTIRISVGLPSTPTPTGPYSLSRSMRWQPLMGPSWGQYGTHVDGAGQGGIFIHSVASGHADPFSLPTGEYNKLGQPASHGCIRVCVADAKWVFDHCNGAGIYIFDGTYTSNEAMKGPLGRKALVPLKGSYDPTDPSV